MTVTHRQSLTWVLSGHELNFHCDVPHGALTTVEVQALWINIEQIPDKQNDERQRRRERERDGQN